MARRSTSITAADPSPASAPAPWHAYLLRCGDGSLYAGATNNVAQRLAAHQAGRGARYTRAHQPVVLTWRSRPLSRSEALRLEARIKRLRRQEKLLLLTPGPARRTLLRRLARA